MFQLDWANRSLWPKHREAQRTGKSALQPEKVDKTSVLLWEEHCHECAPPLCYQTCSLYVARADQKCARFVYGIYPNHDFSGEFGFGADISLRRWGKLETAVYGKPISLRSHRLFHWLDRVITRLVNLTSDALQPVNPKRRLNGALVLLRNAFLARFFTGEPDAPYDGFVLECFSPEKTPFRLLLDHNAGNHRLRHSFEIRPGWNFYTLPAERFRLNTRGGITLTPENSEERRIIFTWLDFVRYKPQSKLSVPVAEMRLPNPKVKCVAWDLDNTLWKGILVEDGERALEPNVEALDLIRKLDDRGIIQTIVSKNNFRDAWAIIEQLQLQDYFLHPAINWQPKSENLADIAGKLNINLDTFALIDDSAFERAEVQSALPQVRVYSIEQLPSLLTLEEFDVPVTEASKKRRASYFTEIKREEEKKAFGGDYEAFLRSCKMKLRVFVPRSDGQVMRCLELIQRANQLNLSNRRYTGAEFTALLSSPGMLCLALDCSDRFGEYGIVGFVSVDEGREYPTVRDMVLSCRVAQKRVEHTFLQWLANHEAERGMKMLQAELIRTERNRPLLQVFEDLQFAPVDEQSGCRLVQLPVGALVGESGIIALESEV